LARSIPSCRPPQALLAGAVIIDLIVKQVLIRAVRAFAKRSSSTWDDALVRHNVFGRLVQVVPALIVFVGVPLVPGLPEGGVQLIRNVAMHWRDNVIESSGRFS
jgi:miniconductance mechanosensitive channel